MEKFLEKLTKTKIRPKFYKTLPETAGVYIFFNSKGPIYIGKAINLRRRVSSYFDLNLEEKTAKMIAEAIDFSYIKVTSELESLLLEAQLIRRYMPHYNIAAKDDKHPLYILITKEKYPRVITARKADVQKTPSKAIYGPFPSSASVRTVLKMLRRIFPYSDHKLSNRACFYNHIGLCNPCPSVIESIKNPKEKLGQRKAYLKNIRHIKSILDGKIETVRKNLETEMKQSSILLNFEGARILRDQITRLEYITAPQIPTDYFMENPNLYEDVRDSETNELEKILQKFGVDVGNINRIECYDIAHLAGASPTASMVTFKKGESDKKLYRHFRINQKNGNSDTDSMREVISRRRNHFNDWGRPDLIIVDGGKPQVGIFIRELVGQNIPIVGLAKRFETLVIPTTYLGAKALREYRLPRGNALNLVQRIRDEAHRFARTYHKKLLSNSLLPKHENPA